MRKRIVAKAAVVLTVCIFVSLMGAPVFGAEVYGQLKWSSGKSAGGQDVKIMFDSHNSQNVRSDSSGNFTVYWSGGDLSTETVKIFFKGDLVYEGFVKHGQSITVYIKS